MFNKKESSSPDVFDTLIGVNSILEGNITTEGTIRIDGKINGDIKVKGDVYIGKDAHVNGSIFANNVYISGRVDGNIEAKGILRSCQLHSFMEIYWFKASYPMKEVYLKETAKWCPAQILRIRMAEIQKKTKTQKIKTAANLNLK